MLIRFEVENFRSIREPAVLSMVAIDEDRAATRPRPQIGAQLLTAVGIFGPNASGKSNVLAALAWLREAVATSLRLWDDEIPVEQFAFGNADRRDTSFVVDMEIDGVRFEYQLELNSKAVTWEALYHYPESRRRRIFEREGNTLTLQRGLGALSGTRALLTDRSLALSIMRRFDEPLTRGFAASLTRISVLGQSLNGYRRIVLFSNRATMNMFEVSQQEELDIYPAMRSAALSRRDQAMALLQLADLGVSDVEIVERKIDVGDGETRTSRIPQLVHESDGERRAFEMRMESEGTRTWFQLIGPVIDALENGSLVLFDELDASLHPTLTARLVDLFQNSTSNPRGAQLVFTTHDTNLLNHLNRDEVWLTQKAKDGGTQFAALSDFAGERVRRSQNLESGYLSGKFGALPDTSRPDVLRELGLIG